MITIAVDCMGGDVGPASTLPACAAFLDSHPEVRLLLVGRPEAMSAWPSVLQHPRCQVVPAAPLPEKFADVSNVRSARDIFQRLIVGCQHNRTDKRLALSVCKTHGDSCRFCRLEPVFAGDDGDV